MLFLCVLVIGLVISFCVVKVFCRVFLDEMVIVIIKEYLLLYCVIYENVMLLMFSLFFNYVYELFLIVKFMVSKVF